MVSRVDGFKSEDNLEEMLSSEQADAQITSAVQGGLLHVKVGSQSHLAFLQRFVLKYGIGIQIKLQSHTLNCCTCYQ